MKQKTTDNSNILAKLELRRHFLQRYGCSSVFDCCQGDKRLWTILQSEFNPEQYLGVDLKPKKGRLKVDSERMLGQPGWKFDVIDVDTYGSPWGHWQNILEFGGGDITVFLTIGLVRIMGGRLSNEVYDWLGLSSFNPPCPPSLASRMAGVAIPYCLSRATRHGFTIIEAKEAEPAKNARYIGLRISAKKSLDI